MTLDEKIATFAAERRAAARETTAMSEARRLACSRYAPADDLARMAHLERRARAHLDDCRTRLMDALRERWGDRAYEMGRECGCFDDDVAEIANRL